MVNTDEVPREAPAPTSQRRAAAGGIALATAVRAWPALAVAAGYLAAHLPSLAPTLEDIDSINFALALHEYDPTEQSAASARISRLHRSRTGVAVPGSRALEWFGHGAR